VYLIFNVLKNSLLQVQEGVDAFLFQLLVLGCLGHSSGYVWRKSEMDYYIIESMPLLARNTDTQVCIGLRCYHPFCGDMSCLSIHHLSYIILHSIPSTFFLLSHMLPYYHI